MSAGAAKPKPARPRATLISRRFMASLEETGSPDRASFRRVAVWSGVWTLLASLAASLGWLDGALADDAFYYFEISRHLPEPTIIRAGVF